MTEETPRAARARRVPRKARGSFARSAEVTILFSSRTASPTRLPSIGTTTPTSSSSGVNPRWARRRRFDPSSARRYMPTREDRLCRKRARTPPRRSRRGRASAGGVPPARSGGAAPRSGSRAPAATPPPPFAPRPAPRSSSPASGSPSGRAPGGNPAPGGCPAVRLRETRPASARTSRMIPTNSSGGFGLTMKRSHPGRARTAGPRPSCRSRCRRPAGSAPASVDLHLAAELVAVHDRHQDVRDHEVGAGASKLRQGLRPVGRHVTSCPWPLQERLEEVRFSTRSSTTTILMTPPGETLDLPMIVSGLIGFSM